MTTMAQSITKIIPLEVASAIIEKYDSTLNIVDEVIQIYGKALDGKGSIEYKNGNSYEGEFTNGLLHGQGTFLWANQIRYTGTFVDNQITGAGKYEWPDGSWYEGEVKLGLRHGKGKFATPGEACIYEGEWKDGLKHGKGIMTFKSGTVYEGEFERGLKHGYGKIVYPSGNHYEGYWAFDKKEGQGTMHWVEANEKYTGGWFDNKQEGWGEHIWLEEKGDGKYLRNRYEGEWRNGMRNGSGVFYYGNGSRYEGEWVDNLKEGFAIFTYEDGKIFKGLYKNDKIIINHEQKEEFGFDDFRKTQTVHGSPEDKKHRTTGTISHATTTPAKKVSRKTQGTPESSEKQVRKEIKNTDLEKNPYDTLLEISDLFAEEEEETSFIEMKELKKLLLRQHMNLKTWYRNYAEKQQVNLEESFALTFKMFWKMLRDGRILSPKVTIAAFNRLFLRGAKNTFNLHTSQQNLKKTLILAKREYLESLSEAERTNVEIKAEEIPEDELFTSDKKVDVHDENKILLFRHFVDAFVRIAYLKYGGAPNFAKKVEQVILKVQAGMETKKKPKYQVEEETILIKTRAATESLKERLKAIFEKFPSKEQAFLFETVDYTMNVKKIIEIFEKSGIVKDEAGRDILLHAAERTNDPEDLYINLSESSKDKDKSLLQQSLLAKMGKFGDLLASEVIFLEFYDIFLLTLFRKDGISSKEEEIKRRALAALTSIEEYYKESQETNELLQERGHDIQWPYSEKDYRAEHLTVEKEKREKELSTYREKKLERENEENEIRLMEKEDFDIIDEINRPPSSKYSVIESTVFAESYNDF